MSVELGAAPPSAPELQPPAASLEGLRSATRALPRRVMSTTTAFGRFLRICVSVPVTGVPAPYSVVWPCPPPFPWQPGRPPESGRRRERWRRYWTVALTTNLLVACLSHIHLGQSAYCPHAARSGMPLNGAQQCAVRSLERLAATWARGPWLCGSRGLMKMQALDELVRRAATATEGETVRAPPALCLRPFLASRARAAKNVVHFDCIPHLPIFEAAAFVEPRLLELPALPFDGGGGWV